MKVTSFSQHMTYFDKGMLNDAMTETLTEVAKAVRETGNKGVINLQLKLEISGKSSDVIKITPAIKRTMPEPVLGTVELLATYDGDLQGVE